MIFPMAVPVVNDRSDCEHIDVCRYWQFLCIWNECIIVNTPPIHMNIKYSIVERTLVLGRQSLTQIDVYWNLRIACATNDIVFCESFKFCSKFSENYLPNKEEKINIPAAGSSQHIMKFIKDADDCSFDDESYFEFSSAAPHLAMRETCVWRHTIRRMTGLFKTF